MAETKPERQRKPREVKIRVHDGVEIAVALYLPNGDGPFPTVLGASPYRYDNNVLPATPQFLWRETGPIGLYVERGYVYAQMDVRGCGKSGGEFRFLDRNEQKDLYDVIEWLGRQSWSNGKVGGIGQSYFCMLQWWMAIGKPPALACIAAFDGLNDPYRASVYQGGILGDFFGSYWWNQNRIINRHPANGEYPREQSYDLNLLLQQHPTYDDFWRERAAAEHLDEIEVPLYSIGVWGKVDLHTRGNIDGFRRAGGPKKLKMIGPVNAFVANREFNSRELHEQLLLPFYDHFLKGLQTDYLQRPAVEYFVRGADAMRNANAWPPEGVRYVTWHLDAAKSGSVTSLNDGTLARERASGEAQTKYSYPNQGWMIGVVGFGPNNQPDPVRRVLTFTTAPLPADLEIAGPIKLTLYASSTRDDMDFFVKLSEQMRQSAEDRGKGLNPAAYWITKGWLRASHRALDAKKSTDMEPYHTHSNPQPIEPGKIYRFDISIEPMAHRFKKGNRVRLEIVNGDSVVTDVLWTHYYLPNKIGSDTIHHSAEHPSALTLPVMDGA
ncbi:MAG TPA: CocE/NonD family hydrolase [Xanthobacteraceae bacterium]|nr:CocE/NonD family hydrolase [Xanthobacteraceae bacterium]